MYLQEQSIKHTNLNKESWTNTTCTRYCHYTKSQHTTPVQGTSAPQLRDIRWDKPWHKRSERKGVRKNVPLGKWCMDLSSSQHTGRHMKKTGEWEAVWTFSLSLLPFPLYSAPSIQATVSTPPPLLTLRKMTKLDDCEGVPGYPGNNNEGIAW